MARCFAASHGESGSTLKRAECLGLLRHAAVWLEDLGLTGTLKREGRTLKSTFTWNALGEDHKVKQ